MTDRDAQSVDELLAELEAKSPIPAEVRQWAEGEVARVAGETAPERKPG